MNNRDLIEDFLAGHVDMHTFISMLRTDDAFREYVRTLLPRDAINNPQHDFWKRTSYDSYKRNQFDFVNFLNWICRFDGTIGDNLNIFSCVETVYTYMCPQICCTKKYEEAFDLYLDAVKDCYDGPEVRGVVEQIINDALREKAKGKRIKMAKEAIKVQFHISENKRPRWIQGPEWPMGKCSPMAFISQKRKGECVYYHFVDVNSDEDKIVTQFY